MPDLYNQDATGGKQRRGLRNQSAVGVKSIAGRRPARQAGRDRGPRCEIDDFRRANIGRVRHDQIERADSAAA